MEGQLRIRLFTKQPVYAVPGTVISILGTASCKELNSVVNTMLRNSCIEDSYKEEEFDFLIFGELLRTTLAEHLESKNESSEKTVEIEYFVKYPAPSPENNLMHDDWVSDVNATDKWILSGCYDSTIHIWNIEGEHKLTIPGHTAPVKSVAWLTNDDSISSFVSTSHDETAMLWQWNQHSNAVDCIHVCKGHARSVDCVCVNSQINKFATGSYDQMLKIWSADDECESAGGDDDKKRFKGENLRTKVKTPLMTLSGHTDGISGVQWLNFNEIITCGLDCTLRIWDIELGGLKNQMNGSKAFLDISYSPLSKLIISGSSDRHVRMWDPRSKDGTLVKSVFSSHKLWVTSVKWSPKNEYQFVTGSMDFLVKMWDTRSPKTPLYDISGHEDTVMSVDWSSDRIISGGADNQVKICKVKDQDPVDNIDS